jgi:hypothetical protein
MYTLRWNNVHPRKETLFVPQFPFVQRKYLARARFVLGHFLKELIPFVFGTFSFF